MGFNVLDLFRDLRLFQVFGLSVKGFGPYSLMG